VSYRTGNLVIVGLGLIGGSLARSLRASGFSERFIGCGHREPSLRRGLELGVIDEYTLDLEEAFGRADILVICTPTLTAGRVLEQVLPLLSASAQPPVVTDVASVKGSLRDTAIRVCGTAPPQFVPGHPIAGSEHSGVEASSADLFVDHRVILTPLAETDPEAVATVRAMWATTGAQVVDMTVDRHDEVLAATSHLPHVLAYALVDMLSRSSDSDEIFRCAAGGFRDFTRIASSDPVMWRDIALANREALLQSMDRFSEHLDQLRAAVRDADPDQLLDTFARAKQARDAFADILARRAGPKPSS